MWSGGVLFGLPIAILLSLSCIAVIVYSARTWKRDEYDRYVNDFRILWIVVGVSSLIVIVALTAVLFWPYKKEYHYWQPVEGTVALISFRLLPAGDRSIEQKYVVTFNEHPHPYGISDTRASLLKKGDRVSLSCKRTWQFASGDHGYDCRWGGMR